MDESALHAWIAKEFDALGIETVFLTHNAHVPYSHIVIAQLGEDAYAFQEFLRGRTFDAVHLLDPYVAYQALVSRSLGSEAFGDAAFVLELQDPHHHEGANGSQVTWCCSGQADDSGNLLLDWMRKKVVELADVVVAPSHFTFENLVLESGFPINANTHVQPTTDSLRHVPADDAAGSGAKAASMAAYMRPQAPRWIDGVAFLGRLASRKAIDAFCDAMDILFAKAPAWSISIGPDFTVSFLERDWSFMKNDVSPVRACVACVHVHRGCAVSRD